MRISELVGLSLGDLELDDGLLRVFGKGAKERLVPVGPLRPRGPGPLAGARRPGRHGRPARWGRRGDAEAVFLNARGGRLSPPGGLGHRAPLRRPGRASATG